MTATTLTTDLNKHLSEHRRLYRCGTGSLYFVQVLLLCTRPPSLHWLLPTWDCYSCLIVCVHFLRFAPCVLTSVSWRRGPKENKYDDQTNSIKPNLLNPIQASKIPVPPKMLHPLVLIPAQCCLQQMFFFYSVVFDLHSQSHSLFLFSFHYLFLYTFKVHVLCMYTYAYVFFAFAKGGGAVIQTAQPWLDKWKMECYLCILEQFLQKLLVFILEKNPEITEGQWYIKNINNVWSIKTKITDH